MPLKINGEKAMRKELKAINGERDTFTATFSRYGSRNNWNGFPEKTYLLKGIRNKDGKILTDHLWIKDGKRISSLGKLKEGDIIQFDARVAPYSKVAYKIDHWYQKTIDYTLKFPTNFQKLDKNSVPKTPEEKHNEA